MLSIQECRKTLEKNGKKYTDEQIATIRDKLYLIADVQMNHSIKKTNNFEERTIIHKSIN